MHQPLFGGVACGRSVSASQDSRQRRRECQRRPAEERWTSLFGSRLPRQRFAGSGQGEEMQHAKTAVPLGTFGGTSRLLLRRALTSRMPAPARHLIDRRQQLRKRRSFAIALRTACSASRLVGLMRLDWVFTARLQLCACFSAELAACTTDRDQRQGRAPRGCGSSMHGDDASPRRPARECP